ncbi:MAG: hypothetical protein NPINA01_22470 [Nitrospinaceae bacterium]|nr:MAG: hypothetical protein NPINA01_22470 [Nitrospinaceae bacterium]
MSSLKGLLFSQFANDGLNDLVEEMQSKYQPKKGRRFHHDKITYEVSRPSLKENQIEFEISSKIPEDEIDSSDKMKTYFDEIKKILSRGESQPASIEMENIVWDSKKETEKERDYVKLVYRYPLDNLFETQEVMKAIDGISGGENLNNNPKAASAFTSQGKLVLQRVRQNIHTHGRANLEQLIGANDSVRAGISN